MRGQDRARARWPSLSRFRSNPYSCQRGFKEIGRSDYTAFLHHLGVASLNLGFNSDETRGIYHSIYDSFTWYSHFSDVDYTRGRALSQVMTTAIMRLSGAPLLPFDFRAFAQTVEGYATEIVKLNGGSALHLESVRKELKLLKKDAEAYESRYRRSLDKLNGSLAEVNELLYRTERSMLLPEGLPGRDWFKNQIYAPGLYTGYGAKTLPGIREAAEAGRWEEANREAEALAGVLRAVRQAIQKAEDAVARAGSLRRNGGRGGTLKTEGQEEH